MGSQLPHLSTYVGAGRGGRREHVSWGEKHNGHRLLRPSAVRRDGTAARSSRIRLRDGRMGQLLVEAGGIAAVQGHSLVPVGRLLAHRGSEPTEQRKEDWSH